MKRKIISLLVMVVLCLNMAFSASATDIDFVIDSLEVLTDSELEYLNDMAIELYEDTDVGIYYVYTDDADLTEYNVAGLVLGLTDYLVMLENEDSWYYFAGGKGEQLDSDALRDAYDDTETYVEGVEAYLAEASLGLTFLEGGSDDGESAEEDLLVWDEAELLSESEVSALNEKLLTVSKKYNAELRVITVSSMDGGDIDEFQHYLYDESDFGYGENRDGVMLLVCMDPREYRMLSNGFVGDAITSDIIDDIGDAFVSDLSDGNYADAFDTFVEECEYHLNGYLNGYPFDVTTSLLVAVGIGLLVGVIVAAVLKGQLNSVHMQKEANVYVKPGSLQITQSGDFFMYRNLTRTERQQSSSSSSGGGGSRSTGGGSF